MRLEEKRSGGVNVSSADQHSTPQKPPRMDALPPISTPIAVPRTIIVGAAAAAAAPARPLDFPEPSASPALPPQKKPSSLSSQPLPPISKRSALMQVGAAESLFPI